MKNIFTPLLLCVSLLSEAQDGILDLSWGTGGKTTNPVSGSVSETDKQKLILLGDGTMLQTFTVSNSGNIDFGLIKYDADGFPLSSFGTGGTGYVTTDFSGNADYATSMVIQSDGKIVVGGYSITGTGPVFAMARYTAAGVLDPTFGTGGRTTTPIGASAQAYAIALRSDDKIILGGTSQDDLPSTSFRFTLAQYSVDGILDGSFGTAGITRTLIYGQDQVNALLIQSDGKILAGGYATSGDADFALARYSSAGVLDNPGFGASGYVVTDLGLNLEDVIHAIRINSTGKIIVGGYSDNGAGDYDFALAQYTSAGVLDGASFGSGLGYVKTNMGARELGYELEIQSDDKIILAGTRNTGGFPATDNNFVIARYLTTGAPDLPFGGGNTGYNIIDFGANDVGFSMDLGAGFIMMGGLSTILGSDPALARLVNSSSPLPAHLSSLSANRQNTAVLLEWQTLNEQNAAHFIIERSGDAVHFEQLGQVRASGSSSSVHQYSFRDLQPLSAVNFYRLRIVDEDGTYSYSKIVVVRFNGKGSIQAFPNPVHSQLYLQLNLPAGRTRLQLMDATGRLVQVMDVQITGASFSTSIDMSKYRPGIYFIRANDETIRVVKE